MKIYTKTGDTGETGLLFGGRVSKSDIRCEAYGTIDEVVSTLGLARSFSKSQYVSNIIKNIQQELFIVGGELATDISKYDNLKKNFKVVTDDMVSNLEEIIDSLGESIELPRAFVVPGASTASSALDIARSVLRRAERIVVRIKENYTLANPAVLKYLNRLEDLLFMIARYEDKELGYEKLAILEASLKLLRRLERLLLLLTTLMLLKEQMD